MTEDATEPPPETPSPAAPPGRPFLVVGVGASAGGLEAYVELLEQMPAAPNLSLLIVSHLDPDHKSELPRILGHSSRMPVRQVTEGIAVEPGVVYVLPAGSSMALADGHLTLTPRPPRPVQHMPIDRLFRSLAEIQRDRAGAVILSGNGSDGVIALQAIKAAGGVTFAQDEASARYPALPRAAALDGNVDHVGRPSEIARRLCEIAGHGYTREAPTPAPPPSPPEVDPVVEILALVKQRTNVDFAHYKRTTIGRRIQRRMALSNLAMPRDYLALLRGDDSEVRALFQDFLIRVTQFFRDPEAFDALAQKAFPALINDRPAGAAVRVWVAGCATGEEVYSLAIRLLEYLDNRPAAPQVKILATDLNEAALERARAGVYLDNIEIDVSPARLRRFFVRHEGHYQISKAVREVCVFSRHNLVSDPPFSRIDLVACRNVLIYMDAALQKRVFPLLHYALNPGGFLFLGSSENVGTYSDLFEVRDGRHRIFARMPAPVAAPALYNVPFALAGRAAAGERAEAGPPWNALDVQREADRVLLARYAPVGVVVDEALTVLQFRGRTAPYLEPAPGMASLDLLRMLREGLLAEVRGAVAQAKAENATAVREGLRVG